MREVHNYVSALEYGLERLNSIPVNLRLIKEIHARLLIDNTGWQRRGFDQLQADPLPCGG